MQRNGRSQAIWKVDATDPSWPLQARGVCTIGDIDMTPRQPFSICLAHAIVCSVLAALGAAEVVSAADLLSFQATPIKGPECVTDTRGYFYAEDEINPDLATALPALRHFYLVVRNLGFNAVAASPAVDFGRLPADYPYPSVRNAPLTGLTVPEPRSRWQRSTRVNSTADDSSAFQMHCHDAGSFINTWTFPFTTVPGGGPHSVYGYDFHDPPPPPAFDHDPATDLVLQVSLEVPWVLLWPSPTTGEQPIGQVSLFAYFRERTTDKLFAVLMLLFDNRMGLDGSYAPYVAHDLRTPFVSMPLNSRASYATLSPVSSSATGVPWTKLRFFRGHITQGHFRSMLRDVNAYCLGHRALPFCEALPSSANAFGEDVTGYDIKQFGVLHEVGRAPDSNISMGVHLYDLGVWHFR